MNDNLGKDNALSMTSMGHSQTNVSRPTPTFVRFGSLADKRLHAKIDLWSAVTPIATNARRATTGV
jgi:hypothetical protein